MKKTLLVAGAGQGLGKAVAKRFAREGYAVALAARNRERLASLAAEIGASAFPADLANEADVTTLFGNVETKLGPIEAVAFIAAARVQGPFAELSAADFERVWRQSCLSGFLVGREAARRRSDARGGDGDARPTAGLAAMSMMRGRPASAVDHGPRSSAPLSLRQHKEARCLARSSCTSDASMP